MESLPPVFTANFGSTYLFILNSTVLDSVPLSESNFYNGHVADYGALTRATRADGSVHLSVCLASSTPGLPNVTVH